MTTAAALLAGARDELARFPPLLDLALAGLDLPGWRARPRPGEWAPVEIVCHLRDEEAEDFGARVRAVLAGEAEVGPIDPERWAVARRYREADPAEALGAFRAHRTASLALLAGALPERLAAAVVSPSGLRLSGLDLLAAWVTHDRLHLRQLAGTLARLWADRWAPLRADYAGPIPYAAEAPHADD
jgi:DinB superfamily